MNTKFEKIQDGLAIFLDNKISNIKLSVLTYFFLWFRSLQISAYGFAPINKCL